MTGTSAGANSSSTLSKTPSGITTASSATTSTNASLPPDSAPPLRDNSSPPSPPLPPSDASSAPNLLGGKQINSSGGGSGNHVLVALLTVLSILVIIFAISTVWCYFSKNKKNKKKHEVIIPTTSIENKYIQEQPLRYFGDSDSMIQSNFRPLISEPPPIVLKDITIDGFLRKVENAKPRRFSAQEIAMVTRDFETKLGSGGFGDVYKGVLDNGVLVAVKRLKDDKSDKKVQEQFMSEVGTIGNTYHINLVRLKGYCIDRGMTALVYEYMEKGSLDKFLFGENMLNIEWKKLHEIAIGTAKGIAYLHEECQPGIIHYDIKPGNILLDEKLVPKVADFGLAKLCNIGSNYVTMAAGCRGTRGYVAPELWKPMSPVTYKCDVYSFGIVLFEIVGRRKNLDNMLDSLSLLTWEKFKEKRLSELVSSWGIEERDKEKAERMLLVALLCIQYLPERRPNMSNVVKMLEGGMVIPEPSYPFERSGTWELTGGSKKNSIPVSPRLRKSRSGL